ncbi:SN protein, partial [Hydrobates tethys]|nr:SN protein [Oceanodroma tethys]
PPRNLQMKAFVESGEGMAVILLCAVESNPPSKITLLKGGQPVASSPPAGGDHPGQSGHISPAPNTLRLELREASEEDEGEYECWARSALGSTRASLPLRVQGESGFAAGGGTRGWGPPSGLVWASRGTAQISLAVGQQNIKGVRNGAGLVEGQGELFVPVLADGPQEPSFISLLEPRGGRQAVLLCTADSFPPSDIALHRGLGHAPLASTRGPADPRFAVQATPNSLRVGVGGLELGGAGLYCCLCNPTPGHLLNSRPPSSSSGVTMTVEPSPEVPEGTTATMTCSAVPWVGEEANYTWYKNSRWLREGPAGSLVLARVSSADAGSYRCRASGTRGSAASAPLSLSVLCECPPAPRGQATGAQSPRHGLRWPCLPHADPPRDVSVSTFLENRSGRVGIVLCTADSHPASTITLYRRGQLLASSLAPATAPGVRASPSHNTLRVELGAVGPEDSGEYTCVAGNPLGNATAGAYFDVRTLTHLLAFTVLAGLLMAVLCVAALALLAVKLWPRMRKFWGWSGDEDTFELRSKQEQAQVGTPV